MDCAGTVIELWNSALDGDLFTSSYRAVVRCLQMSLVDESRAACTRGRGHECGCDWAALGTAWTIAGFRALQLSGFLLLRCQLCELFCERRLVRQILQQRWRLSMAVDNVGCQ